MALKKDNSGDGALFENVDWNKTKAYSLGFASIYVNLKGRESKGVVEDKNKVAEELIAKLSSLADPKNSNKVISRLYKKEEIYSGEYLKNAPDIIIGFNPDYRMSWETAIGGFGKEIIQDNNNKWKGDHLIDPKFVPGVIFSNVKLNKANVSSLDISPTIMDALGIGIPEYIEGGSLLK